MKKKPIIIEIDRKKSVSLLKGYTRILHAGYVRLKQGEECGIHSTKRYEEMLIVLDGEGIVLIDNKRQKICKNNIVYIPPHTSHNVIADDNFLEYVYIVAPIQGSETKH